MSSMPVGKRRGGKGLKGKDEGDDGDGCTLRVADRTEKSGRDGGRTRERARERGLISISGMHHTETSRTIYTGVLLHVETN